MKKWLIIPILLASLFGCRENGKQAGDQNPDATPAKKPVVYVSNYPLYYFANRIGGADIDLHFPASGTADPATWIPPAEVVAAMQQADLVLLNGASYESWLMNVSLPDTLLADTSIGFAQKLLPSGSAFTHSHGEEGEHSHEGVASTTWLDLGLAIQQAEAVKGALSRTLPALKAEFEANYQRLASELGELDRAFKETGAGSGEYSFAFSHPVYQYFQQAYGLEGQSLNWQPDTPLDHGMLHEIGHLKKDRKVQYLIWEREPLPETTEKLAGEGIQSIVINPMGGMPESGDFIEGMRRNLQVLKEALAAQS
jgi:zinc transport system substrate-binding protein